MFKFDLRQKQLRKQHKKNLVITAIFASTIGALTSFFLSPKSGSENRKIVKDGAKETTKKTKEFYQEYSQKAKPMLENAKNKATELFETIKIKTKGGKEVNLVPEEEEEKVN